MDNNTQTPRSGGLYSRVKVSVRTVNAVIAVGVAALVLVLIIVTANSGFRVEFDTDGGSRVASAVGKYGETIAEPEAPVREGWSFTGWYRDLACTEPWSFDSDTLEGDLTLYAGWVEKQ